MSDIYKELDDVLSLLKENGKDITGNAEKLSSEIQSIEEKIENDTASSFSDIKSSLENLKSLMKKTSLFMENAEKDEARDLNNLRIEYFSNLVNTKNEIMNFDITNIDDLMNAFDSYNNEKKTIFNELENVLSNVSLSASNSFNRASDLVIQCLENSKKILNKYQEMLSRYFANVKEKVLSLSKLYLSLYDSYSEKVSKLKLDYDKEKDVLLKDFPSYETLFTNDTSNIKKEIDKHYVLILNDLTDEYEKAQNANFEAFKTESGYLVAEVEEVLSKYLTNDTDLYKNRDKVVYDLKNTLVSSSKINKKDLLEFERIIDNDDLDQAVTFAYKSLKNGTYNYYLDKEKELEKEFKDKVGTLVNNRAFSSYLANKLPESTIVENAIFSEELEKKLENNYIDSITERTDLTFAFFVNEEKVMNAIGKVKLSYDFEKDLIGLLLKKDIKDQLIELKRQVEVIRLQNEFNTKKTKDTYTALRREGEKTLALLNYEINITKLHRDYITAKGIVKMSYELFKKEGEINLLHPQYELKKIIDQYDVTKTTFKTIYDSEITLLNNSKSRNEVMELTNYKYLMSLLNHHALVASEMLDMAQSEYKLRVSLLNDVRTDAKNYSEHEINRMVNAYMDQINEIKEIKEVELGAILQRIEYFKDNTQEKKDYNVEKVNETLDKFQKVNERLTNLIKNDPLIVDQKVQVEKVDRVVLNGIDRAQIIRNKSLEESVKSLKAAEDEFKLLSSVLELSNESINYMEAYNDYKDNYIEELNRINDKLDEDSKVPIETLNRIALYYNTDLYKKQYDALQKEHQDKLNTYYNALVDLYQKIDSEYITNENNSSDLDNDLMNTIDEVKNGAVTELNNNLADFTSKKDKLTNNFNELIISNDQEKVDKIKDLSSSFQDEKQKLFDEIGEVILIRKRTISDLNKVQKKARKDYQFEYEAFSYDLDQRYKEIEKELNEKYKNPTVYDLNGKNKNS